jgi:hypothetical protein
MADNSASWNWASMLNPGLMKNGMKIGISRSKMGFRKYRRTNAPPFSITLPFDPVPFSVPFPFIPGKMKTDEKIRYTVADGMGFIPSVFNFTYGYKEYVWIQVLYFSYTSK